MAGQSFTADLIMDGLPLRLRRSDIVPPAPTRSATGLTLDWIPDYAGYAWVAYGASSLLVISHLPKPSPLDRDETVIGPIIRQVFELPHYVAAVSWSFKGAVAAASDNCIFLFSPDSSRSLGSFCWSQNAVLRQSAKVEAVKWTESGDGIVAGGLEVVLWKTKNNSWEIAWKFKVDVPQTLVSTTWSIEGPSATAAYPDELVHEGSRSVMVYQSDGRHGHLKADLRHPHPVVTIQWSPSTGRRLKRNLRTRNLLLTCCFDGAVRLWAETDQGRLKKAKDVKASQNSFCVVALIEIGNGLKATLDASSLVMWATEIGGLINLGGESGHLLFTDQNEQDQVAQCEWLVGFGPEMKITFWAVHCIDEFSPLRYPRVMLWKTKDLQNLKDLYSRTADSEAEERSLVKKVVISRNSYNRPPVLCYFLHFSSRGFFLSSLFNSQKEKRKNDDSSSTTSSVEKVLSCVAGGVLSTTGHSGKLLQVVVHPYYYEGGLAVSLDSSGLLLFWLFPTICSHSHSIYTSIPMWRLSEKMTSQQNGPKYTSLRWAPSILDDYRIILLGHVDGADCLVVRMSKGDAREVECHKLCTISYSGPLGDGPTDIFSIPLPSTCKKSFKPDSFMLLVVSKEKFHAVSWEVTVHSYDLSQSCCGCNYESNDTNNSCIQKFESVFAGRRYCVFVSPCSSQFPYPHNHDHITSSSVICPDGLFPYMEQENQTSTDQCKKYFPYIVATGCADGTVKLWRSSRAKNLSSSSPWELVGAFGAEQGPISEICLADCGQKIATVCGPSGSNSIETLHVWEPMKIVRAGSFVLEHTVPLNGGIVAMKWLSIGNGEQVLGVCMQEKLQIYAQRRFGGQNSSKNRSSNMQIWSCIAEAHLNSPVFDFFWGPGATAIVVHYDYILYFGQWLLPKHHGDFHSVHEKRRSLTSEESMVRDTCSSNFTDPDILNLNQLSEGSSMPSISRTTLPGMKFDYESKSMSSERVEQNYAMLKTLGLWSMLEVIEELCKSLPVYHPEALRFNIYSGNWKRAYKALRHLAAHVSDSSDKGYADSTRNIPQIDLSSYLHVAPLASSNDRGFQWGGDAIAIDSSFKSQVGSIKPASETWSYASSNIYAPSSSKYEFNGIAESLEKYAGEAAIGDKEKREILAVTCLLNEISNSQSSSTYESLDEPGQRFWAAVRYQQLHFFQEFGRAPSMEELVIESETVCWAFHSDCQESLLSSFLPSESSWKEIRVMGVGLWFNNTTQLRTRMEKLARLQYLKKKDPKDCALLYIALNRLQVLTGLFKISKDEKDKPLVGFLSRNFQEEKNKAAALKNAYVLLGRHQWELSIAFFLLGGDTSSAVNICTKNLGDEQLALVLCRLIEGCGGSLERQLITKFMLPSAIEKDDYWLASLLEWQLGNYSGSFFRMLGLQNYSSSDKPMLSSGHASFSDPIVGLYCCLLATKNCLRNSVGEHSVAVLGRWATLVMATALRRCGLHVEALECFSSSSSVAGSTVGNPMGNGQSDVLPDLIDPSPSNPYNWLSADVALHLETYTRSDIAIHHFSRFIRRHPYWPDANITTTNANSYPNNNEFRELGKLKEQFLSKLRLDLEVTEQKFQLHGAPLLTRMLLLPCNYGAPSIGYDLLQGYYCHEKSPQRNEDLASSMFYPCLANLSSSLSDEVSTLFSRLTAACGITCLGMTSSRVVNNEQSVTGSRWLLEWGNHIQDLTLSSRNLRAALEISSSWCEDHIMVLFAVIDLLEFCACFATTWFHRNSEALILMLQPILVSFSDGHIPYEVDMVDLKRVLNPTYDRAAHDNDNNVDGIECSSSIATSVKHENGGDIGNKIPENERWQILGVSLWKHILRFATHKLKVAHDKVHRECSSSPALGGPQLDSCSAASFGVDGKDIVEQIKLLTSRMAQSLITSLAHVSSYQVRQLAALVYHNIDDELPAMTLAWLGSIQSPCVSLDEHPTEGNISLPLSGTNGEISLFHKLWDSWADPKIVSESLAEEKINLLEFVNRSPTRGWKEIYKSIAVEEIEVSDNKDVRSNSSFVSNDLHGSWQKGSTVSKEMTPFQSPREICRRSGELLEALCINSTYQQQIAVSSHRKGIVFLHWGESPFKEETDNIWSEADWLQNGWAGSESTPVPTFVSPGIGLGDRKGSHLGLGGATIGSRSLATPGRDLTGGGAFGVPGYAGVGASGLGWEVQEDFEELVERPASLETIRTRAFSSHPSMPYFLVGSSNTHIYLWKFGKDKATATYGVLPAANVPPPYSLASVSAVQFDHCGHRFSTAALDGTICTWQLEVGGRSNVHPMESSLCFNSHAMDVTYVTSSGSIIVAAGYSSNNVNVVIWDTLAPPSTSRASIICHEGGARSVAVFDSEIGNSSVSPLILTGGKGGDVGLHDFRFIATGKSKRLRHPSNGEHSSNSSLGSMIPTGNDTKHGIENVDGMLWYLPKAHSGSVTKISRIPNTSLFLTGSKDGDVKLWDVKNAKLVHHWPKLHDRHTFLQPSTRGFGGVVRAGVTDVKVVSHGFLSCGGDGTVKLVRLSDYGHGM